MFTRSLPEQIDQEKPFDMVMIERIALHGFYEHTRMCLRKVYFIFFNV